MYQTLFPNCKNYKQTAFECMSKPNQVAYSKEMLQLVYDKFEFTQEVREPLEIKRVSHPIKHRHVEIKMPKFTKEQAKEQVLDAYKWIETHNVNAPKGDKIFVVLCGKAELSPVHDLLAMGYDVLSFSRGNDIQIRADTCGTLYQPTREIDLLKDYRVIAESIVAFCKGKEVVLGAYGYTPGKLLIDLTMSMDYVVKVVSEHIESLTVSFFNTPSGIYLVDENIRQEARSNRIFTYDLFVKKNHLGEDNHVLNNLAVTQGRNYALAKMIQYWRSVDLYFNHGVYVLNTIAPITMTKSVTQSRFLTICIGGATFFKPMQIYEPHVIRKALAGVLVYSIHNHPHYSNVADMCTYMAVHGGSLTTGYDFDHASQVAAVMNISKYMFGAIGMVIFGYKLKSKL